MSSANSAQESFELPAELRDRIPTLRTFPMPADANANGDIFGGWILSQMDLSGGARAYEYCGGRVVTVGIEAMTFYKPVFIGDDVSFYTDVVKSGRTSVTIMIASWARRRHTREYVKVTEGLFTFVHIDENRQPSVIANEQK
ncbi:MAG: Acyl-CoA thioester hydrolase yciA [Micavibrio sp.]|nr:Acyl-CoA thioester hydrolase yciA [Micavibrio sp.]